MRALSKHQLRENNFRIFNNKFEVEPYQYFEFQKAKDWVKVNLLTEKISILYGELEQSGIQAANSFYIDSFGNHTPPTAVIFSGEMSRKAIAQLLPLDYRMKINN